MLYASPVDFSIKKQAGVGMAGAAPRLLIFELAVQFRPSPH